MNHFDELIERLSPEEVDFRELGDLLSYEQPTKYLVSSTQYGEAHPTPVLTAGQTFILGHTSETQGIYPASPEHPVIIFDDFTTAFRWVDFPFKAKSSAMKMLRPTNPNVEFRFIFYAMQTIRFSPQTHARHWISLYSRFRIPVPPLEVQREIVRILDLFQSLEAELESELEARRRQYEYVRDSLTTFSDEEVPWLALGEMGEIFRGRRFLKADYVPDGIASVHYGEIYTAFGTCATATVSRVREDLRPKLRFAQPGDLVISEVGETVEDVGKAVAWMGDEEVAIHDGCFGLRHSQNPKFLAYWFQTPTFHDQKRRFVARAKVKRLSFSGLASVRLPIPPLEEQERIVAVLDNFDELLNDPFTGIPAELAARRKQYDYYRDRLLSFEEAG